MTRVPDGKQLEGRKEDLFWLRVYKHVIHYGGERAVMVGYITKTMRKLEAQPVAWLESSRPLPQLPTASNMAPAS